MVAPDARELRAPPEARGERLDQYLARAFPELTRSRLQGLIEAGHARVDGKPAKVALRLKWGELLSLQVPAPVPALPVAEELPLTVLHEDRDLVVVDKAAGMVSEMSSPPRTRRATFAGWPFTRSWPASISP